VSPFLADAHFGAVEAFFDAMERVVADLRDAAHAHQVAALCGDDAGAQTIAR
jgi:hypothetical protein